MPNIETIRHEPIVYEVHDYITQTRFGEWVSVKELCEKFYRTFTKSLDTAMRNIVKVVCESETFHTIILSSHDGYKVCQTQAEYIAYRASLLDTFNSYLDRIHAIEYKAKHDDFARLPLGENDAAIYRSIKKTRPTVIRRAKQGKEEVPLIVGEGGQVEMRI